MSALLSRFALVAVLAGGASFPTPAHAAELAGDLAAYEAVGYTVANDLHLRALGWTDAQLEAFIAGLRAGFRGQPFTLDNATQAQFAAIGNRIGEAQAQGRPKAAGSATEPSATNPSATGPSTSEPSPDYLEQARQKFKFQQAASGLLFRIGRYGVGPRATSGDVVVLSFKATSPGAPGDIPQLTKSNLRVKVADLMPGLAEGVQMLAPDGSGLFLLPPDLSFGNETWPDGVRPGLLLVSVELHDIEPADAAP